MPYIDLKIAEKISDERKEEIKTRLGKSISIMHKTEAYLMVGIADNYDLYFSGKRLEKGAYVSVSIFGSLSSSDCEKMTGAICGILRDVLGIDGKSVYVTYRGLNDWGWDGANF